jgi:16S rRNA (cytosine1402-N4)-methyltransferase
MTEESIPHQRRVRYSGKNPVRFEDKYKEHDPERYAGAVEHVLAKGNTPAGAHRPVCVDEILAILKPAPGDICLDATLGYGGHAEQVLRRIVPGGQLVGVDADPLELPRAEARLRKLGYGEDVFQAHRLNFADVDNLGQFDCILADLGVSSMQLDNPARGFTYKSRGPLDLRMDPTQGFAASEMLRTVGQDKLARLLADYADEPHAESIARAIKASRIETTTDLADVVSGCVPRSEGRKAIQRTFMALRICVNQEFHALDRFLEVLPGCLKPGGRVAVLTFHSGEDRRVKKAFQHEHDWEVYSSIATAPILPSPEEVHSNPRSACAKLRWAVRS